VQCPVGRVRKRLLGHFSKRLQCIILFQVRCRARCRVQGAATLKPNGDRASAATMSIRKSDRSRGRLGFLIATDSR
jgi:hypothetical protein